MPDFPVGSQQQSPNIFQRMRLNRVASGKPLMFPNMGQNKTLADFETKFPGSTTNTPAGIADDLKAQEAKRQADILAGRGAIEGAFSRFDDSYYNKFGEDYTGYYNPQIDEQYTRATGKARAGFADRGVGRSSIAAGGFADLFRDRLRARTDVANNSVAATNALRGNVNHTKTDLYGLNESAADPAMANTRAQAEATSLVAPPTTSPIGQVFASSLQPLLYAAQAYRNRAPAPYQSPYPGVGGTGPTVVRG